MKDRVYREENKVYLIGSLDMDQKYISLFHDHFDLLTYSEYSSIELHITSLGGDMNNLQKFVNIIVSSKKPVNAFIHRDENYYGVASAASVLTSYCNSVSIDSDAKFMIHHSRKGGVIDEDEEDIFYWMEKTGQSYDIIKYLIKTEKRMSAEEALNFGFVDYIQY